MNIIFRPIAHSWVAQHPHPSGVIEFIGGALYGMFPHLSYSYFLKSLYRAGYTVIAVPFQFGMDHRSIAQTLLAERDQIRAELNYSPALPHFWVGHSVGCKYITLLEASGTIFNQPSLLIAPDISDTRDALPIHALADWLDKKAWGVRPTRRETQALIHNSRLFNLTALISFAADQIAGTAIAPPETSDVAWFRQELQQRQQGCCIAQEIAGGHLEPVGTPLGDWVVRLHGWRSRSMLQRRCDRQLEAMAIDCLQKLAAVVD